MWRNSLFAFEFAQPPFAWRRLTAIGLLLLMLACFSLACVWQVQATREHAVNTLQQQVAQLMQQQSATQGRHPILAKHTEAKQQKASLTEAQKQEARKMASLLTIRWFDLLQVLEARQTRQVSLLQLVPDAGRGYFVLTGEAENYQTLLQYVGSLQQAAALREVHLQKHQVNEAHPQRPVVFEVQGGWQP
ncbi:hypothetical protein [Methylophilus aquaticus]|uniref:Fimbrial assembly protein n=1 Tax=Methylophilus aquaticus TaxID=1971610 RepID=A0ABT9JUK3_9PROT|nr:hypothetical protein [Methylophilus aquaticus]MDP8568190.1 hypothetical protein [Methylophilus aquaticus]